MKKIIALSFAVAVATLSVSAQQTRETKKDHQMGQHNGQAMKDLNLTEAQKATIKADREAMKTRMDAIKNDPNLTDDQKKEKRKAIMQEERTKMQSVLTAEQRSKMQSQRAEMKGKKDAMGDRKSEMAGRRPMGKDRAAAMKTELGLSDAQASQLKSLNEQTRDKVKAVQSNTSLSEEQKTAQIKSIKEASKAQSQSILTKEQQDKMKSMKKDFKGEKGMHHKMKGDRKDKVKKPQTT